MGLFGFMKKTDINESLKQYEAAQGAVLLDVRTPQEFAQGRIPGSRNLPLQEIDKAAQIWKDKAAPLFVYCLSGARSRQAVMSLEQMGYANVTNIGGIGSYRGKVER